jgi:hypothetical protein
MDWFDSSDDESSQLTPRRRLSFSDTTTTPAESTDPNNPAAAESYPCTFVMTQSDATAMFPYRFFGRMALPQTGWLVRNSQELNLQELFCLNLLQRAFPRGMSATDKGSSDWNDRFNVIAEEADTLYASRRVTIPDFDEEEARRELQRVSVYVIPDPVVLTGKAV